MLKAAIGVLFSFLALVFLTPAAYSADTSSGVARSSKQKVQSKKAKLKRAAIPRKQVAAKQSVRSKSVRVAQGGTRIVRVTRGGKSIQRIAYSPARPVARQAPAALTAGEMAGLHLTNDPLDLKSNVALVVDEKTSDILLEKNAAVALPIASITKLMTGLVV
ncbi:MAG: D-alanyl-D-alanine carboxypeptidase, partial [Lacisediminimonas sp.]|nr:D-alanyl-D-alanine carboxypeptidase [Lacisediminimonas sp.]